MHVGQVAGYDCFPYRLCGEPGAAAPFALSALTELWRLDNVAPDGSVPYSQQ